MSPLKQVMAHHQSAKKRIRQSAKKRLENRYNGKTTRNAVKNLLATTDKAVATEQLPKVSSLVDKLAKKNVIHQNKANHLKHQLSVHVGKLA